MCARELEWMFLSAPAACFKHRQESEAAWYLFLYMVQHLIIPSVIMGVIFSSVMS